MDNLKLEIEGYAIDLLKLDDLANVLTLDFKTGLSDDNTFRGNTARVPLSIPATKRNKEIFENLGFLNAARSQSKGSKAFTIFVNNTVYRSGKCKLIRVDLSSDLYAFCGGVYKIGLYFDTISFFEELANTSLTSISNLASVTGGEHVQWADDIEAVAENAIALNNLSDITYLPIKYSVFLGVDSDGRYIRNDEFTPVIQLRTLLTRILENVNGTTYALNSTFFDTTYFRSLVMPLTAMEYPTANHSKLSEVEINVQAHTVNMVNSGIINRFTTPAFPLTAPYSAANGDVDVIRSIDASLENWQTGATAIPLATGSPFADNIFVAEIEGSYEITVTLQLGTINITGGSFTSIGLNIHAPFDINAPLAYRSNVKGINSTLSTQEVTSTITFYALAGQEVRVGLFAIDTNTVGVSNYVAGTIQVLGGMIKVKPLQIYANRYQSLIIPKYMFAADWKALDVVKGITHAFNLEWAVNEATKIVHVEPKYPHTIDGTRYQGFYNVTPVDLTSKVDLSKKAEILETKNKERYKIYAYKEDSDATIEGLENGAVIGVNKCRYENTNYIEDSTKVLENPYFRNTLMFKDKFLEDKDAEGELSAMPLIYPTDIVEGGDNNETTNEGNGINTPYPILLFFEEANGTTAGSRIRCEYNSLTVNVSYHEASKGFVVDYNSGGSTRSLSYADIERPDGTLIQGLFNTFHAYDAVSQDAGNLVRCEMTLNALDLNNWSFQYANCLVNNLQFNVQSIEKFSILNNKTCRVDLLEYVTPTAQDYEKVTHTDIRGITTTNVDVP